MASKRRKVALDDPTAAEEAKLQERVQALVQALRTACAGKADHDALHRAVQAVAEQCNHAAVEMLIAEGVVELVVPLLNQQDADQLAVSESCSAPQRAADILLEKEACLILGQLANKPEIQARIVACGALPGLVRLLQRTRESLLGGAAEVAASPAASTARASPAHRSIVATTARRAADAITNLAHENMEIKNKVRERGGIPPLVALLEALEVKVLRAVAGALRTLAFKNEDNKKQIVECGALPLLVQLLRHDDAGVHDEAVGVIGNLVHSSTQIKRQVLEEGALQPVISLLQSPCFSSQREAALLLGQFATTDADTKIKIVQRGAVPLLVAMLRRDDTNLTEMAAFCLGRLAQHADNQAGIVQSGGLVPLLDLLKSKHYNLQHNAAFALYGLADNEDNIQRMVHVGALQRLTECCKKLSVQASKDCVQKTISRLEQKLLVPRVLSQVVFLMRAGERPVQRYATLALAKLELPSAQFKSIFLDKRGLEVLLDMLTDKTLKANLQIEAAQAVLVLARRVNATAPIDCLPAQPNKTVFLGAQYVNSSTLADVTFLVEGQRFHAHRIALLASSEAFRAMFNGGYREKDADMVEIPNISFRVFRDMMTFCYTGDVEVKPEVASELLQASDQYLLEGLKRLCEVCIAGQLSIETLASTFELSEDFSAPQLAKRCVLFALERYQELMQAPSQAAPAPALPSSSIVPTSHQLAAAAAAVTVQQHQQLLARMVPHLRRSLVEDLAKVGSAEPRAKDP